MEKSDVFHSSRRDFISKIIPGCAVCCFAQQHLFASTLVDDVMIPKQEKHKFQKEMEDPLTYKQWAQQRNMRYIGILKHLQNDIGKQKLLELLKKASYADNVMLGKKISDRITNMEIFVAPFRNESSRVGHTIVREIIEDNQKVFEMKITQCLTEEVFREAEALDLGYACVCHADFGLPEGMELKIKLTRTKTLMQGHNCCNHRYELED